MRASLWAVAITSCAVIGLAVPAPSHGQTGSGIFPIGRPYTLAGGFSGSTATNVATYTPAAGTGIIPVLGQKVGALLPDFRALMVFPMHGTQQGVSPLPSVSSYPQIYSSPITPMPPPPVPH